MSTAAAAQPSFLATSRGKLTAGRWRNHLLASHTPPAEALTSGFQRALLASSIFLLAAAVVALRITNTRGEEPQSRTESQGGSEPEALPAAAGA